MSRHNKFDEFMCNTFQDELFKLYSFACVEMRDYSKCLDVPAACPGSERSVVFCWFLNNEHSLELEVFPHSRAVWAYKNVRSGEQKTGEYQVGTLEVSASDELKDALALFKLHAAIAV